MRIAGFLKNAYVYSIVTKIIAALFGLLYSILMARFLGADLRGQLTYINSLTGISVVVMTFGIHQAYPYYKRQNVPGVKRSYVHVCCIMFIAYMFAAVFAVPLLSADRRMMIAAAISPILFLAKVLTYVVMVESPNKKNSWELMCEIVEVVFLLLLFLFADGRLEWAVGLIVAKNLVSCFYYAAQAKEDFRVSKEDFGMLRRCVTFGIFPMFSLLMSNLNYQADIVMLGNLVSSSDVGVYSIGVHLAEKIWLISEAVRDVLYSQLTKGKDAEEVNRVLRFCISVCLVAVLLLVIIGKPFILICYGSEYEQAYVPMTIILLGTLCMVYYKIIQAYNVVHRRQIRNFVFLAISVVLNVILNFGFIPVFGINGAALASLVSYSTCSMFFLGDYLKFTKGHLSEVFLVKRSDFEALKTSIKDKRGA